MSTFDIGSPVWKQTAKKWRDKAHEKFHWAEPTVHTRTIEETIFELHDDVYVLSRTATRLRGLLRRLEWTPLWFPQLKKIVFTCVICSKNKEEGHADDCELDKELELDAQRQADEYLESEDAHIEVKDD